MYFILGISLVFTFLYVINAVATVSAIGFWRIVSKHVQQNWSASSRAKLIFTLRVFPSVAALFFVSTFLIPAYILFESRATKETVGFVQALISAVSVSGILIAGYRIFRTWRVTRGLVSNWLSEAEPIAIDGLSIPVYCISHPFPVIAVVGTFRPQMFVARQVFDHLSAEEFQAAIAHETGHLDSRDNFRQTLLRACRDLLVFRVGRTLDREWLAAAEASADEYAARSGGNLTAINLAAALVKIARIVPDGAKPAMPAGAYLIETETAAVAFRIEKLLKITERNLKPSKSNQRIALKLYSALCIASVLLLATNRDFLRKIHSAVEVFVTLQQ